MQSQTQVLAAARAMWTRSTIVFGSQMRDYESRFARLEETSFKETLEMRKTNRRRFDQLESYIKRELESLQARLKT